MRDVRVTIWVMAIILSVANIVSADIFGTGDNQFTIDFVNISGDASSANGTNISQDAPGEYDYRTFTDPSNYYRIGTYEITNDQWNKFVNSYGPVTGSPSDAYDESVYWTGTDIPMHRVSWYEVAQFVNWLNTSTDHQAAYKFTGTQGTGNYTLGVWESGDVGYDASNPYRNSNAFYFLPTEDEWVKAAYWNGTSLQDHATPDNSEPVKNVDSNYLNQTGDQPWNVGSGSEELNGTFDMMGNVDEWMESPYYSGYYLAGSIRPYHGGAYYNSLGYLILRNRYRSEPSNERYHTGFRVASVPEPAAPPVADANGPYTLYAGDTLTLDASGSTDDANDITSYVWDLDDDGVFETDAGTQAVFDVSYAYLESLGLGIGVDYNIHLQVTDGDEQDDTDTTTLTIEPKPAFVIAVDIKPTSCPNPLNVKSKGVLPVAILGSDAFDVGDIDIASIRLEGVAPAESAYEDAASPVLDQTECSCTTDGPDGYMDLTLKFKTQEIMAVLGEVHDGEVWLLYLTGLLYDGTEIEGSDCMQIIKKGK